MRLDCPVVGFEDCAVEIPDEFLVAHGIKYYQGVRAVVEQFNGQDLPIAAIRLFGCVAVLDAVHGERLKRSIVDWPLAVQSWLVEEVFTNRLEEQLYPKKK